MWRTNFSATKYLERTWLNRPQPLPDWLLLLLVLISQAFAHSSEEGLYFMHIFRCIDAYITRTASLISLQQLRSHFLWDQLWLKRFSSQRIDAFGGSVTSLFPGSMDWNRNAAVKPFTLWHVAVSYCAECNDNFLFLWFLLIRPVSSWTTADTQPLKQTEESCSVPHTDVEAALTSGCISPKKLILFLRFRHRLLCFFFFRAA